MPPEHDHAAILSTHGVDEASLQGPTSDHARSMLAPFSDHRDRLSLGCDCFGTRFAPWHRMEGPGVF